MGDQPPSPRLFSRILIIVFAALIVAIGVRPLRPKAYKYFRLVESKIGPYVNWGPPPIKSGERASNRRGEEEARGLLRIETPEPKAVPKNPPRFGTEKKLDDLKSEDRNALERLIDGLGE